MTDGHKRVGRDHFVAVAVSEIGADVFEPIDSLLVRRVGEIMEMDHGLRGWSAPDTNGSRRGQ